VHIDETRRDDEDATTYVLRLAREKAETAALKRPGDWVVAADTTVVVDDHVLEKPLDKEDAVRMLRLLNDRWHQVLTGLATIEVATSTVRVSHETTQVRFAAMTEGEINWYASTGEPLDKAGAYAIQGLGARFIKEIRGDYFNVVGLPLRLLYELFDGIG
jgi:septum formation protein